MYLQYNYYGQRKKMMKSVWSIARCQAWSRGSWGNHGQDSHSNENIYKQVKTNFFEYRHNSFVGWAAIPPKWFGSAVCVQRGIDRYVYTYYIYSIYIVLQTADPNHFGATAGIKVCFFIFRPFYFFGFDYLGNGWLSWIRL